MEFRINFHQTEKYHETVGTDIPKCKYLPNVTGRHVLMKMVCLQWRPVLSPVLCSVSLINLHLFLLYSHGLLSFAPLPGIQHFVCGLVYILQETRAPVSPETNPNQTRRSYQCYEFGSFSCYSSVKKLTAHKNVFLLLQRYITKAATRSSLACGSAPMDVL